MTDRRDDHPGNRRLQQAGDQLVPNTPGKKANFSLSYIGAQGFNVIEGIPTAGRLAHDFEAVQLAQHQGEPVSHDGVVVSDQDPDRHAFILSHAIAYCRRQSC